MKHFRYLVFIAVLMALTMGMRLSTSSSAAPTNDIDPTCLSFCQQEQLQCFFGAERESDQHHCVARYRHCLAQCGKH